MSLSEAVKALLNQSSGTIEEIAREALLGVSCFLQDQVGSDCGGLDCADGFALAAKEEFSELQEFRAEMEAREKERAKG